MDCEGAREVPCRMSATLVVGRSARWDSASSWPSIWPCGSTKLRPRAHGQRSSKKKQNVCKRALEVLGSFVYGSLHQCIVGRGISNERDRSVGPDVYVGLMLRDRTPLSKRCKNEIKFLRCCVGRRRCKSLLC
jgi:hypothetical protein